MNAEYQKEIEEKVKQHKVFLFMRGTPDAPRCGFSGRVIKTLRDLNVPFETDNMDRDPELWQTLSAMNSWPTSPQIYINGEFVGGCDILLEMSKNGELQELVGK